MPPRGCNSSSCSSARGVNCSYAKRAGGSRMQKLSRCLSVSQGARAGEERAYCSLKQDMTRERRLGKKTLENEILNEAVKYAAKRKIGCLLLLPGKDPVRRGLLDGEAGAFARASVARAW